MQHKPALTIFTTDSLGKIPETSLIGLQFKHTGNDKTYTLTGYAWCGESDRWMFLMVNATEASYGVLIARPLEHLRGNREDGLPRYVIA